MITGSNEFEHEHSRCQSHKLTTLQSTALSIRGAFSIHMNPPTAGWQTTEIYCEPDSTHRITQHHFFAYDLFLYVLLVLG